jgi:transcriptional regulator with XRE-family HTH domain
MRYTSSGRNLGMEQTLGDRLRAVRRRLGVSQVELAKKSGVEQQSISRVERNERLYMRSDVLARLVKALGVSADELLGTEPDK